MHPSEKGRQIPGLACYFDMNDEYAPSSHGEYILRGFVLSHGNIVSIYVHLEQNVPTYATPVLSLVCFVDPSGML